MTKVQIGRAPPDKAALLRRLPLLRTWRSLKLDRHDVPTESFVVEFAGMPKAGKSSVIEGVRHFFSHGYRERKPEEDLFNLRYKVHTPAEGVSLRTPAMLSDDRFDFNMWAGAYGLQELIRAGHDGYNDLAVLDRGPWDAGCWLEYWRAKQSDKAPSDLQKTIEFLRLASWTTRADLHVVLIVDPNEAAKREKLDRIIEHSGFASDSEGMVKLRAIYEERFEDLVREKAVSCPHVRELGAIIFDTTTFKRKDAVAIVIEEILNVLEAKVNEHGDTFNFTEVMVTNQLDRYMARMKVSDRQSMKSRIRSHFIPAANALSPTQRLLLDRQLKAMALPEALVEARVTAAEVAQSLDDLLTSASHF